MIDRDFVLFYIKDNNNCIYVCGNRWLIVFVLVLFLVRSLGFVWWLFL